MKLENLLYGVEIQKTNVDLNTEIKEIKIFFASYSMYFTICKNIKINNTIHFYPLKYQYSKQITS